MVNFIDRSAADRTSDTVIGLVVIAVITALAAAVSVPDNPITASGRLAVISTAVLIIAVPIITVLSPTLEIPDLAVTTVRRLTVVSAGVLILSVAVIAALGAPFAIPSDPIPTEGLLAIISTSVLVIIVPVIAAFVRILPSIPTGGDGAIIPTLTSDRDPLREVIRVSVVTELRSPFLIPELTVSTAGDGAAVGACVVIAHVAIVAALNPIT